jgi:hypothetical protein
MMFVLDDTRFIAFTLPRRAIFAMDFTPSLANFKLGNDMFRFFTLDFTRRILRDMRIKRFLEFGNNQSNAFKTPKPVNTDGNCVKTDEGRATTKFKITATNVTLV